MMTATLCLTAEECCWHYTERPRATQMPHRAFNSHNIDIAKTLWDRCVVGLAEVGLNGEWLAVNPALCDLLEYTESELQARTFQQVTHPDDVNDDLEMVHRLQSGQLPTYVMSKRYITKRGRVIWIKLRVDPITDDSGQVVFFLSQIVPAKEIGINDKVNAETGQVRWSLMSFFQNEWKWIVSAAIALVIFIVQQNTFQRDTENSIEKNAEAVIRIESQLKTLVEKLEKR